MSNTDPIAQFLTIIRNGQMSRLEQVSASYSIMKEKIAKILLDEQFIKSFDIINTDNISTKSIVVKLKYYKGDPVIKTIRRISKPGLRRYKKVSDMPKSLRGIGVYIVSTSNGIMTDTEARSNNVGGEILCEVI